MKKKPVYILCFVVVSTLFFACRSRFTDLPVLSETFSQTDKNPFGAFVLRYQLEQLFYHNTIYTVKKGFERSWQNVSDSTSLYIDISKNLFLSKEDLKAMLAYVYQGNSLFISSENIDPGLLDTLGCEVGRQFYQFFFADMKYTSVSLAEEVFNDSTQYQYFYIPFSNHFTKFDHQHSAILGNNKTGINFIVVFFGKGRFYLHTEPRALSNYFLLQKDNYKYLRNIFSFTPAIPEHVYWDDYYNKRDYKADEPEGRSTLSVLLQYPAMAWAFWLLVSLVALYIFFGGKRRQRIVQTIPPNTNTTLAFTETIGRLYLQQKDNRNIADKCITYFLEYIRNQYYLTTTSANEEFINTISRKSNNTREGTEALFSLISVIQQSIDVTDQQLLILNQQIEYFYKSKL